MKGFEHKYLEKNYTLVKALKYVTEITWNLPAFLWVIIEKIYIYFFYKQM